VRDRKNYLTSIKENGGMHKNQYKHQIKPKWGECPNDVTMCIKLKQMAIKWKKK
jgi:hypothetical protein